MCVLEFRACPAPTMIVGSTPLQRTQMDPNAEQGPPKATIAEVDVDVGASASASASAAPGAGQTPPRAALNPPPSDPLLEALSSGDIFRSAFRPPVGPPPAVSAASAKPVAPVTPATTVSDMPADAASDGQGELDNSAPTARAPARAQYSVRDASS